VRDKLWSSTSSRPSGLTLGAVAHVADRLTSRVWASISQSIRPKRSAGNKTGDNSYFDVEHGETEVFFWRVGEIGLKSAVCGSFPGGTPPNSPRAAEV